jgi:glycerol-3-phosphate dehydrogenase
VGGKWTTFRAFSEQAADVALKDLGQRRRLSTVTLPIGGGENYPPDEGARNLWLKNLQQKTELTQDILQALLQRYGTYAAKVAEYVSAGNDVTLRHAYGYTEREIQFLTGQEKVESTADILLRRTLLGMLGGVNPQVIAEVAGVVGKVKNWTPEQIQADIARTEAIFRQKHAMV